jgi:endoglucanase
MNAKRFQLSRRSFLIMSAATAGVTLTASPRMTIAQNPLAGRDLARDKRPVFHTKGPLFGCYDPYGDFTTQNEVKTEHLFLPWEDVDYSSLAAADEYAFARGRKVLVTIEPWSWSLDWNVGPDELRNGILSGAYDGNMRAILTEIQKYRSPAIIRWGHEMENPNGRFTWSLWDPKDYIAAYNRLMAMVREMLPEAQIIWSPLGLEDMKSYYPDDALVDIVGLSVFGYEPYDVKEFGKPRSFVEATSKPYEYAAAYGKPVWICELGYDGSMQYVGNWAFDVVSDHGRFPELKEVIYFNDDEIWPWPHNLGLPQWRVVRPGNNI